MFNSLIGVVCASSLCAAPLSELMPKAGDYTSMWWKDGFPGVVDGAAWERCIQTGQYTMVLDTEAMEITHLGPVAAGTDYENQGGGWGKDSPAGLRLTLSANGKNYTCSAGGEWSRYTGPRLVESGRFFQRGDVTDLEFETAGGEKLNVEARFETAAWSDRLGLILAARPGIIPIVGGDSSFGKVGGGFGLFGGNHLEIPHAPALDPEKFTLELWVFVPTEHTTSKTKSPWLVCKNLNEARDGNYGILIQGGVPQARLNIGGGRDGQFTVRSESRRSLTLNAWNHLAMSYDGDSLRLYVNGKEAGSQKVGLQRKPGKNPLVFGRRGDNNGDGYYFRGVVDEIRFYDRALSPGELRQGARQPGAPRGGAAPVLNLSFRENGLASETGPREKWKDVSMGVALSGKSGSLEIGARWDQPKGVEWSSEEWEQVGLAFDPVSFEVEKKASVVGVVASEKSKGAVLPVEYESVLGWHRVNLDGVDPIVPSGVKGPSNDAIERVKLVLSNPTAGEEMARLMFEKTARGFRQRIGTPITGISATLRDAKGNPIGVPVQLSKNWHADREGGVYAEAWFHGLTQLRLPPKSTTELELTISYGHWGGVPAASHAQLSLIGWGNNQLWHQSALGSWGESICYEPAQGQANCTITDVRPAMVNLGGDARKWGWTGNMGGGDFFRFFDPEGKRVAHSAMRAINLRQGPCLSEVIYAGKLGKGISHSSTVCLARTDDMVRGVYRLRFDVREAVEFSRFVVFQVGADTYNTTREKKFALGSEAGLIKEWDAQWGGNEYRMKPVACVGDSPWVSLHERESDGSNKHEEGANRGIVIRSWKARLGGKEAQPWIAERGLTRGGTDSSTIDLVPPPGVTRLEPGDFIEATIEHIVMPQFAREYYGPNESLRAALEKDGNSWRMIHREAKGNARRVEMRVGKLVRSFPDVRVVVENDAAEFVLSGGLGYVPLTFTNLSSAGGGVLSVDGKPLEQGVHGSDFWQTDYDPVLRRWSRTYNIPVDGSASRRIQFKTQ